MTNTDIQEGMKLSMAENWNPLESIAKSYPVSKACLQLRKKMFTVREKISKIWWKKKLNCDIGSEQWQ